VIDAYPNSRNVVPSRVFMTVDLRHTKVEVLDRMEKRLKQAVAEICLQHQISETLDRIWNSPPVVFDVECVGAVRESAKKVGHPLREIVSGAGHDAVYVSRVAPTAMIFIPCKDGISHNEIESATPEHVGVGASVLLEAVLLRDRRKN
jgi:N-carbamoyl-L-amino-acid hydrolase